MTRKTLPRLQREQTPEDLMRLQRMRDAMAEARADSMERSCSRCQYMVRMALHGEIEKKMVCKRFPPNITTIPLPQGILSMTAAPTVSPAQWCYEFVEQDISAEGSPIDEGSSIVSAN